MFTLFIRSRLASLLLGAMASTTVTAQAPLDLAAVLDQTLRQHPVLARIDAERRLFDPTVALARQSPPLELGVEVENIGDDGSDQLETTLSLAGVLEWGGQRDARALVATAGNRATELALQQQRRDVLAAAASRFIALVGSQQALALAQEAEAVFRMTHEATRKRQRAGAASQADVQRAGLSLEKARMAVANAEQAVKSARLALQISMGAASPITAAVSAPLNRLPALPQAEELAALAQSAPAVNYAHARLSIARSQLELARRQSRLSPGWSIGVRDSRERKDQSLVAGISIPLGQARRNRPNHERAVADLNIAEHERDIARLDLQGLLIDSWQALSAWKREAETLDTQLVPQAEAIVRALRSGYAQGRYSLLELNSAQQQLNILREQRLSAQIQYHQGWIELERLLGRPLIPENHS